MYKEETEKEETQESLRRQLEEQRAQNAVLEKRIAEGKQREKLLMRYAERQFMAYTGQIEAQRVAIAQAVWHCDQMLRSRMFKLMHLWSRIKKQLICGSMKDKKAFFA